MSKQRRLGRGLEALLGRGPSTPGPQIHVPPEEAASEGDTPIQVNQPEQPGVTPRRVGPARPGEMRITPQHQATTTPPAASGPIPTAGVTFTAQRAVPVSGLSDWSARRQAPDP